MQERLSGLFLGFNLFDFYKTNIWNIVGLQAGVGLALGSLSSVLAVQAYLKK